MLYNQKSTPASTCLASATTPTPSLALLLDMHHDIHVPPLQELDRALADVLEVRSVRGDDVHHAENSLLAGCMAVFMVVIVVVAVVVAVAMARVRMVVGVAVGRRVRVRMVMCVVAMGVVVPVTVVVTVVVVVVVIVPTTSLVLMFLGVNFSVCSALVFEPKLGNCVSHHTTKRAQFL